MVGISVKDFGISFGSTKILENISFEVEQGEIVTILGPSGCGKSTILRSIASLQDNYKGDIFINEHCLIKDGKKDCHKDIGYIFQDYADEMSLHKTKIPINVNDPNEVPILVEDIEKFIHTQIGIIRVSPIHSFWSL